MTLTIDSPLFVYGSLLSIDIQHSLFGRIPNAEPGILKGFKLVKLAGEDYPTILPTENSCEIVGSLIHDLSFEERMLLHEYEGELYCVIDLEVLRLTSSTPVTSWCYCLKPNHQDKYLTDEIWHLSEWANSGSFTSSVEECKNLRENYLSK